MSIYYAVSTGCNQNLRQFWQNITVEARQSGDFVTNIAQNGNQPVKSFCFGCGTIALKKLGKTNYCFLTGSTILNCLCVGAFHPLETLEKQLPCLVGWCRCTSSLLPGFNIEVCRNQWISCGQIDNLVTSVQTSLFLLSFCQKVLEEEQKFPNNRMPQTKHTNEIRICAREE